MCAGSMLEMCWKCCYKVAELPKRGMKVVERVLEKRFHRIVSVDEMLFGFMPE